MNFFIGLKNALLPSLIIWATVIYGCASVGTFTPKGAEIASSAVTVATGLLKNLDGFYGGLLDLKAVPDYTTRATRALSISDAAAMTLRQAIAGATVTEAQLNVAAGAVDGSRLILQSIKQ